MCYPIKRLFIIIRGVENLDNTKKSFSSVFIYSALVVGLLVVIGAIFPAKFGEITGIISSWVTKRLAGIICYCIQ